MNKVMLNHFVIKNFGVRIEKHYLIVGVLISTVNVRQIGGV